MALKGEDHPFWKGDDAGWNAKHRRAQRKFTLSSCEKCGEQATDRHHIDGDPGNNDASNIMLVCAKCHQLVDGRYEKFIAMAKNGELKKKPPRICDNCGDLKKHYAKGLCANCYSYLRKHGVHRPFRSLHEKTAMANEAPCKRCSRPSGTFGRSVKGYCLSCYYYVHSGGVNPPRVASQKATEIDE